MKKTTYVTLNKNLERLIIHAYTNEARALLQSIHIGFSKILATADLSLPGVSQI